MKLYLLLEEGEPNAILFGTIDAYFLPRHAINVELCNISSIHGCRMHLPRLSKVILKTKRFQKYILIYLFLIDANLLNE